MVEAAAGAAGAGSGSGAAGMSGASWVPTAINSGSGLVGSLAGMFYNAWAQNRQNEWNAQQMRLQNQWNIDQWNRENSYNTPLRQMMRLQAAGINPALAYSNGQLMNEAASSPAMEASQGEAPQVDPSIFTQLSGLAQQQKLIDSQANLNNANAEAVTQKLPEEVQNLQKRNAELDQAIVNLQKQCEEMSAHIRQMDADTQLKAAQNADISFRQTLDTQAFQLRVKEVEAMIEKIKSEVGVNNSIKALNERRLYEDIQSWSYRLLGFDLENERIRAVTGLTLQQTANAKLDGQLLGFDVINGTIDASFMQSRINALSGKNGKALSISQGIIEGLIQSAGMLLSPLKGVLHFGN